MSGVITSLLNVSDYIYRMNDKVKRFCILKESSLMIRIIVSISIIKSR